MKTEHVSSQPAWPLLKTLTWIATSSCCSGTGCVTLQAPAGTSGTRRETTGASQPLNPGSVARLALSSLPLPEPTMFTCAVPGE